jgi:DNA-directed RNA polymerase specialized sigma24 family protein
METAEDIVGEFELAMLSMTEAQRKIAFEQPEKYWGYFYRMVRNKAVDCHRKFFRDKAPRKELSTYSDGIIDAAADDVLQELHAKNLKELLNADADGNLWTFMRLRYEGMNREAIMNTMNISKHSYTKLSKKLENFLRKNQR